MIASTYSYQTATSGNSSSSGVFGMGRPRRECCVCVRAVTGRVSPGAGFLRVTDCRIRSAPVT